MYGHHPGFLIPNVFVVKPNRFEHLGIQTEFDEVVSEYNFRNPHTMTLSSTDDR